MLCCPIRRRWPSWVKTTPLLAALAWSATAAAKERPKRHVAARRAGYAPYQQDYVWRRGDSLSVVLASFGLGKSRGPLQIYGAKGWLSRNQQHNSEVRNWDQVAPGQVIHLLLPVQLRQDAQALIVKRTLAEPKTVFASVQPAKPRDDAETADEGPDEPEDAALTEPAPAPFLAAPASAAYQPTLATSDWLLRLSALSLGAGLVSKLWQRRDRQRAAARWAKEQHDLYLSTQAYVRTAGRLSLVPAELLEPAEDFARRFQVGLLEGMLASSGASSAHLAAYYRALDLFRADQEVIQTLAAANYTGASATSFPPSPPAAASTQAFLDQLATDQPKVYAGLNRFIPPAA